VTGPSTYARYRFRMPIDVGTQAPDFTLKDQNNQEVALADFRGRKAVLLVFYPLAFTGTCQGELAEIRDNLPEYANDDAPGDVEATLRAVWARLGRAAHGAAALGRRSK